MTRCWAALLLPMFLAGCNASANRNGAAADPDLYGHAEAERDIAAGHLEIRVYGLRRSSDMQYARLLGERYAVTLRSVAGCAVPGELRRETDAYNQVMTAAIERRFGVGVLQRTEAEARRF